MTDERKVMNNRVADPEQGLEDQEKDDEGLIDAHRPPRSNTVAWVPKATREALQRARVHGMDRTVYDHDPY